MMDCKLTQCYVTFLHLLNKNGNVTRFILVQNYDGCVLCNDLFIMERRLRNKR